MAYIQRLFKGAVNYICELSLYLTYILHNGGIWYGICIYISVRNTIRVVLLITLAADRELVWTHLLLALEHLRMGFTVTVVV